MKERIILEYLENKSSTTRKGKIDKMSKDHVNKFLTTEILTLKRKISKIPTDYFTTGLRINLD